MKNRPKLLVILGIIFVFVIAGASLIVSSQTQNNNSQNKQQDESPVVKKIRQNQDPIAEYNALESKDSKERELRRRRNAKFGLNKRVPRPEKFELSENSEEFFFSSGSTRLASAFPITNNNLVVIGRVVEANAFLSDDKSRIYSEFGLKIQEVLKKVPNTSFTAENVITITRQGGKLRLPSKRIIYRGNLGFNYPNIGKRYLMFLGIDRENESFDLITAYELQDGKVRPLDGDETDGPEGLFSQQYFFYGTDESTFVNLVKTKIFDFEQGGQE